MIGTSGGFTRGKGTGYQVRCPPTPPKLQNNRLNNNF